VFWFAILIGAFAHPSLDANRRRQVHAFVAMRRLIIAAERYKADCGRYPVQGLDVLAHGPGVGCWKGPYLDGEVPTDPWGRVYVYRFDTLQPEIISYGADGEPRGKFFDADLSSRNMWVLSTQTPTEIRTQRVWIGGWFSAWVGLVICWYLLSRNRRYARRARPPR
jgi:Type II secretion system (T2SS), protein G